jgi:SAM-dependent methyltransferase
MSSLLEQWDRQQEVYIAGREERFETMLTVVEWHAGRSGANRAGGPVVVDLACGPAAIGRRLLARMPSATYVGIDIDPVLLHLARQVAGEFAPERMQIVECDVADPAWLVDVAAGSVDVVCSSTALHWLSNDELERALSASHRALRPGGVLLNADHLGFESAPTITALAEAIALDEARQATADGAPTWDQWWRSVRADPTMAPLRGQRDAVFPPAEPSDASDDTGVTADRRPPLSGFVATARRAGFAEVDTIWQRFDDRIVMAVRA